MKVKRSDSVSPLTLEITLENAKEMRAWYSLFNYGPLIEAVGAGFIDGEIRKVITNHIGIVSMADHSVFVRTLKEKMDE